MNEDIGVVLSTFIALFVVWYVTYILNSLANRIGAFQKKRKFKKMIKTNASVEVITYDSNGTPTCVKYKDGKDTIMVVL